MDSVAARSFLAGFTLETAHVLVCPQPDAVVDLALGQLDEIVRDVRDIAFQSGSRDMRIQPPVHPTAANEEPHDTG